MAHVHGEPDSLTRQNTRVDSNDSPGVIEKRSTAAATRNGRRALDERSVIFGFDRPFVRVLANTAHDPAGRTEIQALRMSDGRHRVTVPAAFAVPAIASWLVSESCPAQ